MPKVSVIMGIFNCAGTLSAAVDSILTQTSTDWELIMCDDASQDETYRIAGSYAARYPEKIILIQNIKNMMLAATLNRCLQIAQGKYIARMDADDISQPTRLEKQVAFLDAHPEYAIVGTYMQSFNDKGLKHVIPIKQEPDKYDLPMFNAFHHATIMMRREIYTALGGYTVSEKTRRAEDVDLWFRFFAKNYRGYTLDEPLYWVRENEQTYKRRKFKYSLDTSRVLLEGIRRLGLPHRYRIYCLKPVIAWITPQKIKILWRARKFKN